MPAVAGWLHLPMRTSAPEPWALGVRLAEEPEGVHRLTIGAGAPADGHRIDDLPGLPEDAWISLVVRDNQLLPVRGDTPLQAGDQLLIIAAPEARESFWWRLSLTAVARRGPPVPTPSVTPAGNRRSRPSVCRPGLWHLVSRER